MRKLGLRWMLVQYIGSPERHETRNVGVIVSDDRGVAMRFLGDRGEELPPWIASHRTYRGWVDFWHRKLLLIPNPRDHEHDYARGDVWSSWPEHTTPVLLPRVSNYVLTMAGAELSTPHARPPLSARLDEKFAQIVVPLDPT